MKNSNDTIENRTRDLPTCSAARCKEKNLCFCRKSNRVPHVTLLIQLQRRILYTTLEKSAKYQAVEMWRVWKIRTTHSLSRHLTGMSDRLISSFAGKKSHTPKTRKRRIRLKQELTPSKSEWHTVTFRAVDLGLSCIT
jgi:hypothetical protein